MRRGRDFLLSNIREVDNILLSPLTYVCTSISGQTNLQVKPTTMGSCLSKVKECECPGKIRSKPTSSEINSSDGNGNVVGKKDGGNPPSPTVKIPSASSQSPQPTTARAVTQSTVPQPQEPQKQQKNTATPEPACLPKPTQTLSPPTPTPRSIPDQKATENTSAAPATVTRGPQLSTPLGAKTSAMPAPLSTAENLILERKESPPERSIVGMAPPPAPTPPPCAPTPPPLVTAPPPASGNMTTISE